MLNKIQRKVSTLVTQAGKAIAGMALYVAELSLPHAIAEGLAGKLAALIAADNVHKQAKVVLKNRQAALAAVVLSVRAFMTVARDVVKPVFGNTYSQSWDAMGLVGSLMIPRKADALLPVLLSTKGNFTATPALENEDLGVTAVLAGTHYDALLAANNAYLQQKDVVDQAKVDRDEKARAMESALRILLSELHVTMEPLDSRWVSFGFKKPGALNTPDVPDKLVVALLGNNAVSVKWDAAARAQNYRIWKKVIGVDVDYVLVGSSSDLHFLIEGLPLNAQVEVVVSASNNGGESAKSDKVTVTLA